MPKKLPKVAEQVLLDLEQFVLHAAVDYEHHWFFGNKVNARRYQDVFSAWSFWYAGNSESSWTATIVSLSKFYETNHRTTNIHYLMELLAEDGTQDWSPELAGMNRLLDASKQTAKDITIIRSSYHIHKSRDLSFGDTYGLTKGKWNDVRALIEQARQMLNIVVRAIDGREIITEYPIEKAREELTEIMDRLQSSLASTAKP